MVSDSVRPRRRQPTRLPHPWDSPGKNTGVGCHFLLQCRKVKSENEVAQSCPTLRDPMDCSLPSSSIHGIFQARVMEWGAIEYDCVLNLFSWWLYWALSQVFTIYFHIFFGEVFVKILCQPNWVVFLQLIYRSSVNILDTDFCQVWDMSYISSL